MVPDSLVDGGGRPLSMSFCSTIAEVLDKLYAGGQWASAYIATLGKYRVDDADPSAGRSLQHRRSRRSHPPVARRCLRNRPMARPASS